MKKMTRLMAAALALLICISTVQLPVHAALAEAQYGVVTADQVKVRKEAGTSDDYWFMVDRDYVCEITGQVTRGSVTWYKVEAEHPEPGNVRTYVGYIHGDFFRPMTEAESNQHEQELADNAANTNAAAGTRGKIMSSGVNFRETPGGNVFFQLNRDDEVEVLTIPAKVDAEHWYQCRYNGFLGYVQAPYLTIISGGAAGGSSTEPGETIYVKLILSSANLRLAPAGTVGAQWETTGEMLLVTGEVQSLEGYKWYPVEYEGAAYYVRSDCVQVVRGEGVVTPTPTATANSSSQYVKLILSSANLRLTPGGTIAAQWETTGEMLLVTGEAVTKGGYTWYPITYNGSAYYVRNDCVQVISASTETATPTPTPTPTATAQKTLYVKLILSSANLRLTPGGTIAAQWETTGETLYVTGNPVTKGGYTWYPVNYKGSAYFVRNDCVQVIESTETPTPTPTNTASSTGKYVKLILSSANLRLSPAGTVAAQWETTGEILAVTGATVRKGNYLWYPVSYKGSAYYVRNDCVQEVNADGSAVTPDSGSNDSSTDVVGYVKTIKDSVNLRLQPAGMYIEQVPINKVVPMLKQPVNSDGYTWYYVQVGDVKGYLRGDCVTTVNADGSPTQTQTPPTSGPAVSSYGYVRLVEDKVNLRRTIAGSSITQLSMGTILPMTGYSTQSGSYIWYPVMHGTTAGYVRGDCVIPCNQDGTAIESTPTTTPDSTVSAYGYVKITVPGVNVRKAPGDDSYGTVGKDTVWPMTGEAVKKGGYTWYPINAGTMKGYVRGDCSFKLSPAQQESYLAGNGVPDEVPDTGDDVTTVKYVQTVLDKVNLREGASKDSKAPYNISLGTVMTYTDVKTVGGATWYNVIYNNEKLWVLGSCVKAMTDKEYQDYLATNPANTPQPEVIKGYIKTTTTGVNLRSEAAGSKILGRVEEKGTVLYFVEDPVTERGYKWYRVKHPTLGYGWLRGDCVAECDKDGNEKPGTNVGGDSSDGKEEASYTTLRLGSTGDSVKKLVAELKEQGYYTGNITSTYTSSVEAAVRAFQKAKGLTVDGIAGSETQHTLFDTVPVGSGTGTLTMTLYPAEKIDWYTGGIQQLWPKGANFKIYDVYTGIVWWAHRWSGGAHADIEPLTAADTARLCKMYGVDNAQDIYDKNMWERRPSLVTINGHTYACSLDGMPHNPDGDTIPNNNMVGQICLHFTNSKGHASGVVSDTHQEAVEYAWKNCPAGRK